MAAFLEMITGLRFKNKKAAAFGCYGWSGESIKILTDHLTNAGFAVMNDGLKAMWQPSDEALTQALEFGEEFAGKV